jgi:hypothetical protein
MPVKKACLNRLTLYSFGLQQILMAGDYPFFMVTIA